MKMMERPSLPSFIVTLSCPDRMGIVADVSRFFFDHACNIVDSAQFGDADGERFFLRTTVASMGGATLGDLETGFAPVVAKYQMDANIFDAQVKVRTLVLVSRLGHCLNDLLFRWRMGALPIDLVAVVSNHTDFAHLVAGHGLRFHHLPVTHEIRTQQEEMLTAIIKEANVELVVLARYMQVLSPSFCAVLPGRIINIHHSFLPSFKGANPYRQAHARGVKLIGATAHFATEELDDGPIIEQMVERVRHDHSVQDYMAIGGDVESLVLSRAVKWYAERRILINGLRTVVFR